MPAFAVHEPDVVGVLPKLVALVPTPAAHEFVSLQLVGSVQRGQPALLYAPHELSQLSVVPRPLKPPTSANAAFENPGIGQPAASACRVPPTVAAARISHSPTNGLKRMEAPYPTPHTPIMNPGVARVDSSFRSYLSPRYVQRVLRLTCCLLLVSSVAHAAPSEAEQRFRAEVSAVSTEAGQEYIRASNAGDAGKWDEALAHYRRAAELAPKSDHPHRRMCGVLANLGRADEAVAECETALSLAPGSPYDKLALANAMTQAKRDLPRAVALAKEALPELAGDPVQLGMYCAVLLDARTLPGIDAQLDDCIKHLYVLDPVGMESNYLGAVVAALRGNRELAHHRLDVAKKAGLPDAAYTQLGAEIDGRPQPVTPAPAKPSTGMGKLLALGAVIVLALVALLVIVSRRRRDSTAN